jgi:5-methyltetrahydropteroyltriglutamate--homocysteine methyltransferase
MKRSTERFLTTHAGSLPRPAEMLPLVLAKEEGEAIADETFDEHLRAAVEEIVQHQAEVGVDVLNDGEAGKPSYASYVHERMSGFTRVDGPPVPAERLLQTLGLQEFPQLAAEAVKMLENAKFVWGWTCDGPVSYPDLSAIERDIEILKSAASRTNAEDVFMSAASPGIISVVFKNQHYPSYEEYIAAIADAMRLEYEAIYRAGVVLQLDCPELAGQRPSEPSLEAFREKMELRVEALNHATEGIPAEAMRIHVCWGNGENPRLQDVPLADIIDILLKAKPAGIMLMSANGRHEHEWKVFEDVKLPEGKYIITGVLDSTTNIVEHPEVVAQRLLRYASVVPKEQLMAGTDCGFSTAANGTPHVDPGVTWKKFEAMSEGAAIASKELWGSSGG